MGHYVTKQPGLRFYRDGEIVTLPLGASVPEAESLPNFSAMMRIGQLAYVDGGGGDALAKFDDNALHAEQRAKKSSHKEAPTAAQAAAKEEQEQVAHATAVEENRKRLVVRGKQAGKTKR